MYDVIPPARPRAAFIDHNPQIRPYRDALLEGLGRARKAIAYAYLYDAAGSALFDRITELPEYYPTRVEADILRRHARDIAARIGPDARLFEPGAGSAVKVRTLLDVLERPAAYVPVDISGEHLRAAADALQADYPALQVTAVRADHTRPFPLPEVAGAGRRVGFYPGSSIGNLQPDDAVAFLREWAERLGEGAAMVVGVDLRKDPAVLQRAYDDAAGVTAAFTLNLLARANREAEADFDLGAFAHRALWNEAQGRIEIALISLRDQTVTVAGRTFAFAEGEAVHVEDSYKYTRQGFDALAAEAGFQTTAVWTDADQRFGVWFLERRSS
jgi:dimethylhistidine N-methyltransferase